MRKLPLGGIQLKRREARTGRCATRSLKTFESGEVIQKRANQFVPLSGGGAANVVKLAGAQIVKGIVMRCTTFVTPAIGA